MWVAAWVMCRSWPHRSSLSISAVPPVDLYDTCGHYIDETFARAKVQLYSGMHLARIYREAGLPPPTMLGMARVETGPDTTVYEYMAQTIRSLLPLIERMGVATKEEVDIDTLADRLRDECLAKNAVLHLPELIAAWARTPVSTS